MLAMFIDKCRCYYLILALVLISGLSEVDAKLELNVQVLICTDYSIYKLHESIVMSSNKLVRRSNSKENAVVKHIKDYYAEIMDQVNERYRNSFKNDPYLNINIELAGFYIAMDPNDAKWSEMNKYEPLSMKSINRTSNEKYVKLNGDLALKDFNQWVEMKRPDLVHFDHAFGLTAYDIVSNQDDVDYNGLAYIYGICKNSFSGSIIEDKAAYESVRSFAHELGHNLGADHDGLSNSECSEWENYIMASKFFPYNQLNSWLFSNCSIKRMKEYLLDFDNNFCLLNRDERDMMISNADRFGTRIEGQTRIYPGEVYDSYEQCQRLNGPFSTPCFEFQSSFCENLYCHKNDTLSECVWVAPAAEGTECGLNLWCQKGKCLPKINYQHREVLLEADEEVLVENQHRQQTAQRIYHSNIAETEPTNDMSTSTSSSSSCEDIMDFEFCETALQNEFCDGKFYWNGRNIGQDWCKKYCKKCST